MNWGDIREDLQGMSFDRGRRGQRGGRDKRDSFGGDDFGGGSSYGGGGYGGGGDRFGAFVRVLVAADPGVVTARHLEPALQQQPRHRGAVARRKRARRRIAGGPQDNVRP